MNNSIDRLVNTFFYGLYMDPEILRSKGIEIRNPKKVFVKNYTVRIGKMATMLREDSSVTYGMVYQLTHKEIFDLYEGSGITSYVKEALMAECDNGDMFPVICCNLLTPPHESESNDGYLKKLISCMERLELPAPVA